jgi:hypothetical protein
MSARAGSGGRARARASTAWVGGVGL